MANLDDISIPTILRNTLIYITERTESKGVVQHPTGFLELDFSLQGLRNGELIAIASRPAQGKSTLLMNMMLNNLDESETTRPIIIATGLTSATQYMLSFMAILSGIKQDSLKKGNLDDNDWPKLKKAFDTARDFPLYVDDSIRTISQLENLIDQVKEKYTEAPIVAIDDIAWLHLRDANFFARQSREIVSRLKEIAKSRNIPIVFTANISKEIGEGLRVRKDNEIQPPTLLDIDYILQYEPWVDKILLMHREDVYNAISDKKGLVEIIIAKNSMGATNNVMLSFYPEFGRFENNIYADEELKK